MATGNQFLDRLEPDDLAELLPHMTDVDLPQGAILFEPHAVIDQVHFMTRGALSAVIVLSDGRTVEAVMVGREGVIGSMTHAGPVRAWARGVIQMAGAGKRMSADRFREVVERRPELRRHVGRYITMLNAELQQAAACNAVHRLEQRMAKWLLRSADRVDGPELPLTQEFLGDMLGAQRTTVTQIVGELAKKGLVLYRRGRVTLRDRAGLERVACECYGVTRRRAEALAES